MEDERSAAIQSTGSKQLIVFQPQQRLVNLYGVSEDELDNLACAYTSINQMLFGAVGGFFIAVLTTLLTVALDDRMNAVFWALGLASFVLGIFLLGRVLKEREEARRRVEQIKSKE